MASANGLVFAGFDQEAHPGFILFKGPFGTVYPLNISAAATDFTAPHGQWSKFRRGNRDGQTAVVAGVHDKVLYAFIVEEGVAMPLKGANNGAELAEVYDLVKAPQNVANSVIAQGPLGNDYTFDVTCLQEKYGLRRDEKFSINGSTNVYAVGELFGCLWIKHGPGNQPASPLPGATSEKALHELYLAGEPAEHPGISTPRKTAVTTPRAGIKPPFVVDTKTQSAQCQAAFGNTITVDTSRKSLIQWGVTHGQKFLGTVGPAREKQVTIVGSHLGALYIHIEGDRKVTCCRNCENGDELAEVYGFGSGGVKREVAVDEVTPVRSRSTAKPESAKKTSTAPVDSSSPVEAAPRSTHKKKLFTMWTSFGRQSFDISPSATNPFGYAHGMTVKATRGLDKDTIFHVVGENGGILWVVQDGKPRAVALRHCQNKEDIQQRFGFVVQPGKKDLTTLSQLETEPAHTPVQTPRGSVIGSPRGAAAGDYTPRSTMDTPRGATVSYASGPTSGSSPATGTSSSVPASIPALNFNALSPQNLSNPPVQQNSEPRSLPYVPTGAPPTMPQTSSCHRNYLKAVALLKTGAHSAEEDKLRFHKYYMTNTAERLGHAMGKLNTFREAFNNTTGSNEAFERASCNEMLTTMRRRAEIFA